MAGSRGRPGSCGDTESSCPALVLLSPCPREGSSGPGTRDPQHATTFQGRELETALTLGGPAGSGGDKGHDSEQTLDSAPDANSTILACVFVVHLFVFPQY